MDHLHNKLSVTLQLPTLEIKKITSFWHTTLKEPSSLHALMRGFVPITDFNILKKVTRNLEICIRVLQFGIYALQKMFRFGIWKLRNDIYQDWVNSTHGCSYRSFCKTKRRTSKTNNNKGPSNETDFSQDLRPPVLNAFDDITLDDQGPKRDSKGRILLNKEEKREWVNTLRTRTVRNIITGGKLEDLGNLWLYKQSIMKNNE